MPEQTKDEVMMDGQCPGRVDPAEILHELALLKQAFAHTERERDFLRQELTAARDEVTQLLHVLAQLTEATRRRPPQPPPAVPLGERIRQYLEASDRPRRAWQVARALQLEQPPHRELARLVERGLARRLKEGVYTGVAPTPPVAVPPTAAEAVPPAAPPPTLRQRVLQVVLESDTPVRIAEVQAALDLTRKPDRELGHLVAQEKLRRVEPGLFAAPERDTKHDC